MQPLEATRAAMAEITTPIVTIGLVLAAVFVPVAFIPGLTGRLYNQFAMTIVFSFLFSAFNSLTFTPAMARLFLKPKHGETKFPPFRWFNRGLKWVEDSYDSFLDFGAHHWWTIVLPSLGLLALTGWLIYERPKAFIPTEDQGYLIVIVQTPDGTTREPTSRVAQRVGQIAGKLHGVRDALILDGYNAINAINQTNAATAFVILEEWHHRTEPKLRAVSLARELQRQLSEQVLEATVAVLQPPPIQGLSSTGGFDFMIEDREGKGIAAMQEVAVEVLPEGFGYEWTGTTYQEQKTGNMATYIFALSIVCVFLFMSALYESWIRPLVIILTVPLATFGAMIGLWLYDMPLGVFGQIGLVMLIGLETKNAILIVEFGVELIEKHGMSIIDSAKEAARQRLRPILMTSFAFVFGVLPMANATGAGAYSRNSLGVVIAFGIAVSTILGRFVIPIYYVLGERLHGPQSVPGRPSPTMPVDGDGRAGGPIPAEPVAFAAEGAEPEDRDSRQSGAEASW